MMRFKLLFYSDFYETPETVSIDGAYKVTQTITQDRPASTKPITRKLVHQGREYENTTFVLDKKCPPLFKREGYNHRLEDQTWKREVDVTHWYIDMPDDLPSFREKARSIGGEIDWDDLTWLVYAW